MKINYIILNNIGPYVGENKFNLDTNSLYNIILVGGKNGAGKTSFLRGMKYGLFGSFSLGLKTDTDKYFNEIKSLINNKSKSNYYVQISFDFVENFATTNYILTRKWNWKNGALEEKLTIKKDNILLDDYEVKEISDKLRAITSPQLINSFIFDGEKISNIIENGEISSYLQETFNSIFNIDLISQTKKDLEVYLSKRAEENQSKDQIESIRLISTINTLKGQIKLTESELSKKKEILNNLISMKKANTDNFYRLGGLTKGQQEAYSKKIDSFNKEKDVMNHQIRNFMETNLPLVICNDLLRDVINQCNKERQSKYLEMLNEIESFSGIKSEELHTKLNELISPCNLIQKMEESQVSYINDRYNDSIKTSNIIKTYLNNKIISTDEYKLFKKAILDNENIDTINKLIDENKKIDISIVEMEENIKEITSSLADLKNEFELSYALYEKKSDEIKKSSLYDSSFAMGKNALDLCEHFAKRVTISKLKKISKVALDIFDDTLRKDDFIKELSISKDFELTLKNDKGTIINPKTLSAGEMQILVSSLIWAMFKVSGRREMFIFDTPLARLDIENRHNFITKIISTISSQVVILSTDSEFVGDNLRAIENKIYKKYLLEYNVKDNSTKVTENYFGGI